MTEQGERRQGFTLLELLMVVIIIAILASIALPQYMRVAERTRASEALGVLATMRSSELRYKANDPGSLYTTNLNLIDADVPGFNKAPLSNLWTYTVSGTAAGSDSIATRIKGVNTGKTINLDMDGGASCSNAGVPAGSAYGLPSTPC
jgi:type IV pilus assembly protein PilA